ncbi:hypothetical protein BSNK01_06100 [Bacillaceae bacterium]
MRKRNIAFRLARLEEMLPDANKIKAGGREYTYDFLVLATGVDYDWNAGKGADSASIYHYEPAVAFGNRLEKMNEGSIVIGILSGNPQTGMAYELVFKLHEYFCRRGMRKHIDLIFLTLPL